MSMFLTALFNLKEARKKMFKYKLILDIDEVTVLNDLVPYLGVKSAQEAIKVCYEVGVVYIREQRAWQERMREATIKYKEKELHEK